MIADRESPQTILVCGDWHGNLTHAKNCLWYANRVGAQAIIQVGDFGFWTDCYDTRYYLEQLDLEASEWGIPVYWLDGNHEDHSRKADFNSPDRPHTVHLPRGFRWSWRGTRFMALGGAHSVDKQWRKEGVSWWPGEHLTDEEVIYASRDDGIPVDVVFAHDCPTGVDIPTVGPDTKSRPASALAWPPDALHEAEIHRKKCRKVWKNTAPRYWIHGHYHIPYTAFVRTGSVHTEFIGLGRDGDLLTNSVTVVTLDSGPDQAPVVKLPGI